MNFEKVQEQLDDLQFQQNKIVAGWANEIIKKSSGKSVRSLRKATLDFIKENQVPNKLSINLRRQIDEFIDDITI